jgi:hypothetical protein
VVRAGEAPGLIAGARGAGFGTTAGCVGGAAGTGTRGAATIVRGSGTVSVLVADDELGGSLGLATASETVTAGSGGGSPWIAMTAIPTITPREVAATPAATSRNMTTYRLADWARSHIYAATVAPAVPYGTERARVGQGWPGLARVGQGWREVEAPSRGLPPLPSSSLIGRTPRTG